MLFLTVSLSLSIGLHYHSPNYCSTASSQGNSNKMRRFLLPPGLIPNIQKGFSSSAATSASVSPSAISRHDKHQLKTSFSQIRRMTNQSDHAWANILYRYDKGNFGFKNCVKSEFIHSLSLDETLAHATNLKLALGDEAEHFFGVLPDNGNKLSSVFGAIQQTFGAEYLYPSVVEQAAHLFYLTIKDHPFIDGNKRIAVDLCVHFLTKNALTPINKNMNEFRKSLAYHALYAAISKEKDHSFSLLLDFLTTSLEYTKVNDNN